MIIYCKGVAKIEHEATGQLFEIQFDELEWEPNGGSDRSMGSEEIYIATVEHDELGELTWTLSEYPVGTQNHQNTDVGKHQIIEDFDFGLRNDPEEWFDPDDPSSWKDANPEETSFRTLSGHVSRLVQWFHHFYEHPQNEMPPDKEEGGYFFVYGGPYDAETELQDEFGSTVPYAAIEQAVEEIQSDGTFEWSPSQYHPDQIAAAKEYIEREEAEARSGFGLHLSREPKEIALNGKGFALAVARLFKNAEGEFSFALLGRWGSGKTLISKLVSGYLQDPTNYKEEFTKTFGGEPEDERGEDKYKTVQFNAWRYRQKPELWVYLYESFLTEFLDCNLFVRILRTIRVGMHKHGIWSALFALFLLAFSAFPLMWISLLFTHALPVFGIFSVVGLVLLAQRWNTSLRRLYNRYGIISSHREHLGMQAVIGDDLKALVASWAKTEQFKPWETRTLGGITLTIGAVWFCTFLKIDFVGIAPRGGEISSSLLVPSLAGWLVWCCISAIFYISTITNFDRIDRIFLVVDDLDRCPQEEIVDLIDGIKLMIDDKNIGNVVQALILADDTILDAAVKKRFEGLPIEDARRAEAVREHMEKVFLSHAHIPKLSGKDVNELVGVYAHEFGLEADDPEMREPSRPSPTQKTSSKSSTSPETTEQTTISSVLTLGEQGSIRFALTQVYMDENMPMTPRMVRSFLCKYQLVRMLLQLNGVSFQHGELATELALAILQARTSDTVEVKEAGSSLSAYVRMVA